MRRAIASALMKAAEENSRLIFLTGDLGFQVFDEFRDRFGPRYVNVGVAEAQLVCAAAGLAREGWNPVTYSIASFMTGRAFEQVRVSVAYPRLPVVILGAGGGYSYSTSGVTHHAADDLGLMSLIPGMTVAAPGDGHEASQLLQQALKLPGPSYLRIGRYGEPEVRSKDPVVLGRARLLSDGERVAILSMGDLGSVVGDALDLLQREGIRPLAYQMHTVKPLDTDVLDEAAKKVDVLITVEEHLPVGGLAAAVSAWRDARGLGVRLLRVGAPDAWALGNLNRDDLRRKLKLDVGEIAALCRQQWRS
jgi:transketolase